MYEIIDPIIQRWAARHNLQVSREFAGRDCRFTYVAGGQQECFQVSIDPTELGMFVINAWSVETIDDAELSAFWTVPPVALEATLSLAIETIQHWISRDKGPPTWTRR